MRYRESRSFHAAKAVDIDVFADLNHCWLSLAIDGEDGCDVGIHFDKPGDFLAFAADVGARALALVDKQLAAVDKQIAVVDKQIASDRLEAGE